MLASLSSWLHTDDESAATDEATDPSTAASPETCVHDESAASASATFSPSQVATSGWVQAAA